MPDELSDELHAEIKRLCERGDQLADDGDFQAAVKTYEEAFEQLPQPWSQWEAATWILVAMADAFFRWGNYAEARSALRDALHCPDALGNPFIHLRLGQSQMEIGEIERAKDELTRAYMGGGREIFEDEDPKYFDFLKTFLRPPANGEW